MQTELDKKKLESVKADLEYNLRASEYNVEILKNQNENLNTELTLLKKHSDKQKKYIMINREKYERIGLDMEYYKKQANSGMKKAAKEANSNVSAA